MTKGAQGESWLDHDHGGKNHVTNHVVNVLLQKQGKGK